MKKVRSDIEFFIIVTCYFERFFAFSQRQAPNYFYTDGCIRAYLFQLKKTRRGFGGPSPIKKSAKIRQIRVPFHHSSF
jgi:hypothetical protein